VTFYLSHGQRMEDLVNADYEEKLTYIKGMEDFFEFENEKIKASRG